jgi:hypothetical protein
MDSNNINIKVVALKNSCNACLITKGIVVEILEKLKKENVNIHLERIDLESLKDVQSVIGLEVEKFPAVIVNGEQITAGSIPSKKCLLSYIAMYQEEN